MYTVTTVVTDTETGHTITRTCTYESQPAVIVIEDGFSFNEQVLNNATYDEWQLLFGSEWNRMPTTPMELDDHHQ